MTLPAPLAICAAAYRTALETGAAAAVELESGDARAEAGVEGGDPADRGVLAAGVAVARDDVVDVALALSRCG
ncbi:hypothetical protein [Nocardioides sp. B-3]|uniref:hypothetical protein n=1 Tax=Nocardioides sp. B-3 TaxID=2895565 RepID=UPI0021539A32|nr:hypothetical protein [Nocardioides sp. B-3]UUZ60341.1 hypothetical protein LP418_05330 [Nocardioides sp. B-3]